MQSEGWQRFTLNSSKRAHSLQADIDMLAVEHNICGKHVALQLVGYRPLKDIQPSFELIFLPTSNLQSCKDLLLMAHVRVTFLATATLVGICASISSLLQYVSSVASIFALHFAGCGLFLEDIQPSIESNPLTTSRLR